MGPQSWTIYRGELTLALKIDTYVGRVYTYVDNRLRTGSQYDSCFPAQSGKLHVTARGNERCDSSTLGEIPDARRYESPEHSTSSRALVINPLRDPGPSE